MAYDVFISYSRKDLREALELSERLQVEGLTVWIDRHGIGGAKQWAAEISKTIRECHCLLLLISENAAGSPNVLKEVTLAAERGKSVLPVILRNAELPDTLQYHLAGVHYLHYADHSSIVASLKGQTPIKYAAGIQDNRKSVMVLPFDDLSPGQDNGWFADGLTSELISMLSKITSLRVIDRNTSMAFRNAHDRTNDIAQQLSVRYILGGAVRKFEEQIKINVELLDTQKGEYLWHDEHKGTFSDIFGIQEILAQRVVDGLKLSLTLEESKTIGDPGTNHVRAYELFLKAMQLYDLWKREEMDTAVKLLQESIDLDPHFAEAYRLKAMGMTSIYRLWDRNPSYLVEAESAFQKVSELRPNIMFRGPLLTLYVLQGRFEEAEALGKQIVASAPLDFLSHFYLAYFYFNSSQIERSISPYEEALRLNPTNRMTYWNLVEALDRLERADDRKRYSFLALPHFERWLLLHPEDQFARAQLATFQLYTGEKEKALRTIEPLIVASDVDGLALYTVAGIFMHLGEMETAMGTLDRAVSAGFSHFELLKSDPNFAPLADTPRFKNVLVQMSTVTT